MRTLRAALTALAMIVAVALSGCAAGAGAPGTAAVVDGRSISQAHLDRLVRVTGPYLNTPPAELTNLLLQVLIADKLSDKAVATKGLTISQEEIDKQIASSPLRALAQDPEAREVAQAVGRWKVVTGRLSDDDQVSLVQGTPIVVDPRYGTWNPKEFGITPGNGSLSQLASPRQ